MAAHPHVLSARVMRAESVNRQFGPGLASRITSYNVCYTKLLRLLRQLANLPQQPESVPINMLVKVKGTPLENAEDLDKFDFIRTIAVARIMMPASHVRLSRNNFV